MQKDIIDLMNHYNKLQDLLHGKEFAQHLIINQNGKVEKDIPEFWKSFDLNTTLK